MEKHIIGRKLYVDSGGGEVQDKALQFSELICDRLIVEGGYSAYISYEGWMTYHQRSFIVSQFEKPNHRYALCTHYLSVPETKGLTQDLMIKYFMLDARSRQNEIIHACQQKTHELLGDFPRRSDRVSFACREIAGMPH